MPRVLIAGFTALPGPHRVGVQLRHIMRALVRHHKVDVLVLRRGEQAYVERAGNARILRVPVPDGEIRGRVEAFRRALRRQLEGADYDVVHVSDGWAGQTVLELQPQLKYAVVYDAGRSPLTGPLPLDVSVVSELQRAEADCAARADLVLAPTEPARQFLAAAGDQAHAERVHLVAPGVDVDLFDWDLPPSDGPPLILYVGTLSQGRGIQVLLGAMIELVRRTDADLILAGRAGREFRQNLAATLSDLNLDSRVTFRGVLDHARVPELISRATVCVAPAAPETKSNRLALYPTKILEYLACQRAVVAPRRSSVSLLLRHEQTGLLFEPGQPTDLAETIERALTDHALRARIARAGYDLVRRAHSASSTRRELTSAYAWLSNQPRWRARFSASDDQSSSVELRMPGAQDTEAAGWPRLDKAAAFEPGSFDSDEVMLNEPTGSGSIETSLGDGVGEVTRVEISPLLDERGDEQDTRSTSLYPIDKEKVDDWVVEDSNTRPVEQSGVVGDEEIQDDSASGGIRSSMDASFVAGEIRSNDTAEVSLGDEKFTAISSLLGVPVEEEKTRLFELPQSMIDGRTLEKNVLEAKMQQADLKEAKAALSVRAKAEREKMHRESKMLEGKTQIADVRRLVRHKHEDSAPSASRASPSKGSVDSSHSAASGPRKRASRVQSDRNLPLPSGSRPLPFSSVARDPGATDLDLGSAKRPPTTMPPIPPPPFPDEPSNPLAFPANQPTASSNPPPSQTFSESRSRNEDGRSVRRDAAGNPVTQPFPRIDPRPSDKRPGSDSS